MAARETRGRKRWFGPLDPYCWCLVGALAVLGVIFVIGGLLVAAVVFFVLAALVLPIDKYWNRP